ncbi:MAG: hypothetical protein AAF848_06045 [Pseudomonadota bacterium]
MNTGISGWIHGVVLSIMVLGNLPVLLRGCDALTIADDVAPATRAVHRQTNPAPYRSHMTADNWHLQLEQSVRGLDGLIGNRYFSQVDYVPRIIAAVPQSVEDHRHVFGEPPTKAHAREVEMALDQLGSAQVARIAGRDSDLLALIEDSDTTVVYLIGHNDGGHLRFSDGSSRAMADVAELCASLGKRCIFLSCRSAAYIETAQGSFGIQSALTFGEAIRIAGFVDKLTRKQLLNPRRSGKVSLAELDRHLTRSLAQNMAANSIQYRLQRQIIPAAAAAGIGYISYSVDVLPGKDSQSRQR